ncbi:hypothetical protein CP532_3089 [Ophiocordyceps camponoti-leonardi (nom. inval.)]|nr:hypothetical protein CP532_3089 [Ophiocordyceps camponoti-leonardi (nom. inval.)]
MEKSTAKRPLEETETTTTTTTTKAKIKTSSDGLPPPHKVTKRRAARAYQRSSTNNLHDLSWTKLLAQDGDDNSNDGLPPFILPLPDKMAVDDAAYLRAKGALTIPSPSLQSALLRAYAEFVHPYMPLLDLDDFLAVVGAGRRRGSRRHHHHHHRPSHHRGRVSLFLYQAVAFASTAFVDMRHLHEAGFATRKAARKAFFQRTRLLYDLDYEADRLVLVQGLMLMTYWYETPDDQKDTWHWMGVAVSLAHTIGLHRDPSRTTMTLKRQRLCKRVWWSCVMRDRLIALGMRRPTRIKDEDFDVPMLTEADFAVEEEEDGAELEPEPEPESVPELETELESEVDPASASSSSSSSSSSAPSSCPAVADANVRRELAQLCVAKARLCLCIGHMLKAQYSFMLRREPHKTTSSTMMLFPLSPQPDDVAAVDAELDDWLVSLPPACRDRPLVQPVDGRVDNAAVAVQRTLLHMFYHTVVAALHRPQFLLAGPIARPSSQDVARLKVRDAAAEITRMAAQLHALHLDRFLPTTAVTVLLPAMMVHLLDMKSQGGTTTRHKAVRGFRQCMRVIEKLRDMYTAADYATGFLDAALRKAAIDVKDKSMAMPPPLPLLLPSGCVHTPPPEKTTPYMTEAESLFAAQLDDDDHHHHHHHHLPMPPEPTPTTTPTTTTTTTATTTIPTAWPTLLPPPDRIQVATALDLSAGAGSPPHTDPLDSADMTTTTPSASGGSDAVFPAIIDFDPMMLGPDEFDWNAMAGADFDVDQWLQFPPDVIAGGGGGGGEEEEEKGEVGGNGMTMMTIDLDDTEMMNNDGLDGVVGVDGGIMATGGGGGGEEEVLGGLALASVEDGDRDEGRREEEEEEDDDDDDDDDDVDEYEDDDDITLVVQPEG